MIQKIIGLIARMMVTVICLTLTCLAQSKEAPVVSVTSCSIAAAAVDSFAQSIPREEVIIVIAYRGQKEKRKGVEIQRLANVKSHLIKSRADGEKQRLTNTLITAVADDFSEVGSLKFYVNGLLTLQLNFVNNFYLGLPCYD
jgi:hypothetical protein